MRSRVKNTCLYWLTCFGFCLLSHQCVAEEPTLDVSFDFGYNGVVPRSMRIIPVKVTITNRLRNVTGRIEILQPSKVGNEVVLFRDIKSPAPSTLTFMFFPRAEPAGGLNGYSFEGRVVFDDKSIKTFSKRVHAKSDKRVIVTCGLSPHFLKNTERLPTATSTYMAVYCKQDYQFIAMHSLELPATHFSYDSVHAVILNGLVFNQLTQKQLSALRSYAFQGGRLMIYNPVSDRPFRAWTTSLGLTAVSVKALGSHRIGAGYLIIQPSASNRDIPFWLNPENEALSKALLPEISISKRFVYPLGRKPKESGLLELFTERRNDLTYGLAGVLWLGLIILVYCLIIGPLDWLITKRTGRHWLTWPFFACSILIFSLVSYKYSQFVQSAPMTSITLNILNSQHGHPTSKGESFLYLHSTGNLDFHIESAKTGTIFNCRESSLRDQSPAAWVKINNASKGNSTIDCRIPVFSSKRFTADWLEDTALVPTVKAATPLTLELKPGLFIDQAYIAGADGVRPATYVPSTGELKLNGSFKAWSSVFAELETVLMNTESRLPSERDLQQYLLAISYGETTRPVVMDGSTPGPATQLNEWEYSQNIAPKLNPSPKTLFIFFKPESSLNTYSINRRIPNRIEVNCLRYLLPTIR